MGLVEDFWTSQTRHLSILEKGEKLVKWTSDAVRALFMEKTLMPSIFMQLRVKQVFYFIKFTKGSPVRDAMLDHDNHFYSIHTALCNKIVLSQKDHKGEP